MRSPNTIDPGGTGMSFGSGKSPLFAYRFPHFLASAFILRWVGESSPYKNAGKRRGSGMVVGFGAAHEGHRFEEGFTLLFWFWERALEWGEGFELAQVLERARRCHSAGSISRVNSRPRMTILSLLTFQR